MYVLHTYTMNDNQDDDRKKLLDSYFYTTTDNVELLKTMLAHKVDPNMQDSDGHGDTPLHFAASNIYPEYICILITAGANPNKINFFRQTPLHEAAQATEPQYDSIQLSLNAKANPTLVERDKNTALHYGINSNVSAQTVELLLSAKANTDLKNIYGNTPLHRVTFWPAVADMAKAAQLLLQYGAQVDVVNNNQYTPLQLLAPTKSCLHARKMGRLFVWYQYILLPHFIKQVPEKAHAWAIASYVALECAENKTIWS